MAEKFQKPSIKNLSSELEKINFTDILKNNLSQPIIFDTNFLFVTFQFNIDIISELEKLIGKKFNLYIYQGTIEELANLERKKTKNKHFIPLIAKLLKLYNFKIITSSKTYIDDQILENLDKKILIATNDKPLRQKILSLGYRVLYVRQKSYLEIK